MRKLWKSFFENITTDIELDKFLRSISGKAIQDWEHDYQEYNDNSKQIIKRYFEENTFTENLELEGLKQDINWISLYAPICEKYVEEIKANINGFMGSKPESELSVVLGPVASVIADPHIVEKIKNGQIRDIVGIEMEIFGVYYAARWSISPKPKFVALKSVCDFADADKDDKYHAYASFTSARVFIELAKKHFEYNS